MATIKTNFKGLFAKPLDNEDREEITSILIPRIQRSYAQGRDDDHAIRTRKRFLNAIHDAVGNNMELTLDFIYGNIKNGCLVPLDGQQRLTTLFLLHWYAKSNDKIETDILRNFTYETRYSARDFCHQLADYRPQRDGKLSEIIRDEPWCPMDWRNDPTVNSMLTMLDDIQDTFSDVPDLWNRLDKVNFYFLSIDELKLTDEVYIKMNSRGKPLTTFEHFKAEWLHAIAILDEYKDAEKNVERIGHKLDCEWTDMLWPYRGENNIIDDAFLTYFRFVCMLICYRENDTAENIKDLDEFLLLEKYFKGDNAIENTLFVEHCLDIWADISARNKLITEESAGIVTDPIGDFFKSYISDIHEPGKIMVTETDSNLLTVLFGKGRFNKQRHLALLYTFMVKLMDDEAIEDKDFRRRLRIVWNLIRNSHNEVVDTPAGDAGNRMPAILKQIESIVKTGQILDNIDPNFHPVQLEEEKDKLDYTIQNPSVSEHMFELEDHPLLLGRLQAIDYKNPANYSAFRNLFKCNLDLVDQALLTEEDYGERTGKNDYQIVSQGTFGDLSTGVWSDILRKRKRSDMGLLYKALSTLLKSKISDDELQSRIDDFINDSIIRKDYSPRFYYMKYPVFRRGRYGKYGVSKSNKYDIVALYTSKQESSNAYQCFLEATGDYDRSLDIRGKKVNEGWLWCEADAWVIYDGVDTDAKAIYRLPIPQSDGTDTVDRISYYINNSDVTIAPWQPVLNKDATENSESLVTM